MGGQQEFVKPVDLDSAVLVTGAGAAPLVGLLHESDDDGRPMIGLNIIGCALGDPAVFAHSDLLVMDVCTAAGMIAQLTSAARRGGLDGALTSYLDQHAQALKDYGGTGLACTRCHARQLSTGAIDHAAECPHRKPS
jgi:hypothetical protein